MDDPRPPFDEAKRSFLIFLQSEGWPTELRWVSRDRLVGHRRTFWVLRPEELADETATRAFYEAARSTQSSLRIDALGVVSGKTLAYVHDWGGVGRHLNFGHWKDSIPPRPVSSLTWWACVRIWTRLLGTSPFLTSTRFTLRAA